MVRERIVCVPVCEKMCATESCVTKLFVCVRESSKNVYERRVMKELCGAMVYVKKSWTKLCE